MDHPPEYFTAEYQRRTLAAESVQYLHSHAVRYYFFLSGYKLPLGTASFTHIELSPPSCACCRLGYRLDRDFTGHGYMTRGFAPIGGKYRDHLRYSLLEGDIFPQQR